MRWDSSLHPSVWCGFANTGSSAHYQQLRIFFSWCGVYIKIKLYKTSSGRMECSWSARVWQQVTNTNIIPPQNKKHTKRHTCTPREDTRPDTTLSHAESWHCCSLRSAGMISSSLLHFCTRGAERTEVRWKGSRWSTTWPSQDQTQHCSFNPPSCWMKGKHTGTQSERMCEWKQDLEA